MERIRAQATAMQESSDLLDIVVTMRTEFVNLGHDAHYFWHMRWLPEIYKKAMTSGDGSRIGMVMTLPRHIHGDIEALAEWEKSNEPTYVLAMDVDTAVDYVDKMITLGDFEQLDPQAPTLDDIRHIGGLTFIMARTTHGEIGYSLPGVVPEPPKDAVDTLVRFAGVFDLAYRRFEDLKKAEAQARENQIELALERVRARTMAMQASEELADVAFVLFEQLRGLGGNLWGTGFGLCEKDSDQDSFWFANENGVFPPVSIPNTVDPAHKQMYEGWKGDKDFMAIEGTGKELKKHYDYMMSLPEVRPFFQKILDEGLSFPEWQQWNAAYFKHGYLLIITLEPYPDPDILKRFAKVFDQTYTRFLDLKKAEFQAREGQINLAVERVRAKALAMFKSEEILKVVNKLKEEIMGLEIPNVSAATIHLREPGGMCRIWDLTSLEIEEDGLHLPLDIRFRLEDTHPDFFMRKIWNNTADYFVVVQNEHDFKHTLQWLRDNGHTEHADEAEEFFRTTQIKKAYHPTVPLNNGRMCIDLLDPPAPEVESILKKMARAFDLAYKRFEDLRKAEEQAREAELELSLERIRSQVTVMQESTDLFDIVVSMRNEFLSLGHKADYFWHMRWLSDSYEMSMTSEDGSRIGMVITLPKYVHEEIPDLAEWEKGDDPTFVLALDTDDAWDYIENMNTHGKYEQADPNAPTKDDIDHIGGLTFVMARTTHGEIGYGLPGVVHEPPKEAMETLVRFAGVFDLAFKRFEDLKAKERQHREAQIELALERVRARTMAMQHSDELAEASQILDEQVRLLGIDTWGCAFHIYSENEKEDYEWFCSQHGVLPFYKTPRETFFERFYEIGQSGKSLHIEEFSGEACKDHYEYLMDLPVIGDSLKELAASGAELPEFQIDHVAYFNHGYLLFITYEPVPEAHDVFKRFAKVFDQTYTRFLDLQKAEAQTREAKIETALEKVRSRTMGMQSSDELPEVANLLFLEIQALGIPAWSCGYNILNNDKKTAAAWMSSEGTLQEPFTLRLFGEASFDEMGDFVLGDEPMLVQELGGKELEGHYEHMKSFPDLRPTFENIEAQGLSLPTFQINHLCKFSHGFLLFITYEPVPEAHDIFKRFTKVFDQTYTRFLDLQKAEAQTREAKIETALEKVRSRTMGMQNSVELPEVANLLFLEVQSLGINAWSCGYCILEEDRHSSTCIMSSEGTIQKPFLLPHLGETSFEEWDEFVHSDQTFFTQELTGETIESHYDFMKSLPQLKPIFKDIEDAGLTLPTYQINHLCKFSHGFLLFISYESVPEAHDIFKRFTRVFDQTYTRFLDLTKAEAQARESQIEAALEKVRSRSMGMQSSDELIQVVREIGKGIHVLGINTHYSQIFTDYSLNPKDGLNIWVDVEGQNYLEKFHIPYIDHFITQKFYNPLNDGLEFLDNQFSKSDKDSYFKLLFEHSDLKKVPRERKNMILDAPGWTRFTAVLGEASLNFGRYSLENFTDEEKEIFKRVGKVFGQAYTRFLDLQKAEKQANEAMKQASLDRVRGEIASMRSTDDLENITPLIWNELNTLGVPFIRCGVFIIHEEEEQVEVYLSKPNGTSLAVMHLPFDSNELVTQTVEAWRNKEAYTQHWSQEEFLNWGRSMMEQGQVPDLKAYQGAEEAPESLHLHFMPFDQGMLYVGSTGPLDDEEISLSESLAKAFSIAYARYEDFVKLEKAKAGIEKALAELKATQNQLIQQEKLASLGQLTAGIAHEIKNPLNFVNNFSELSVELIEEARDEVKKQKANVKRQTADSPIEGGARAKAEAGDDTNDEHELILEILNDIEMNLRKIHEHGSRADSIVKSMLQHSRGGNGKMEPTPLNPLIKEYVNLAFHGMRAGSDPINVDIDLQLDEILGEVPLVAEDFSRVVLNLVNNAFDAMRDKANGKRERADEYLPKLRVVTKAEGNTITIEIKDNGPGIPEEMKDKILQPFFTTKKGTEGTGLGLSISNDIIKAHGGNIEVESSNGEGSTVRLHLPHLIKQPS
ncbi:MAG TPA: ATP-binding protein [Halalkalibaculum sp.]|nr:ATP-binding protein [Halalkalibaculum sp.]